MHLCSQIHSSIFMHEKSDLQFFNLQLTWINLMFLIPTSNKKNIIHLLNLITLDGLLQWRTRVSFIIFPSSSSESYSYLFHVAQAEFSLDKSLWKEKEHRFDSFCLCQTSFTWGTCPSKSKSNWSYFDHCWQVSVCFPPRLHYSPNSYIDEFGKCFHTCDVVSLSSLCTCCRKGHAPSSYKKTREGGMEWGGHAPSLMISIHWNYI